MTATPSSEARAEARAEAERRYPAPDLPGDNIGLRVGFVEGAEWKGAQDAELFEALRVWLQTSFDGSYYRLDDGVAVRAHHLRDVALRTLGVESSDEGEADGRHGSV
jgi:hypothetical protein